MDAHITVFHVMHHYRNAQLAEYVASGLYQLNKGVEADPEHITTLRSTAHAPADLHTWTINHTVRDDTDAARERTA